MMFLSLYISLFLSFFFFCNKRTTTNDKNEQTFLFSLKRMEGGHSFEGGGKLFGSKRGKSGRGGRIGKKKRLCFRFVSELLLQKF